jgi:hypothetical protein
MKIDKSKLKIGMWYEDKDGNVINNPDDVFKPDGAVAYFTKWPLQVTETAHNFYDNKDTCRHPHKAIKRTSGWIKGIKGRRCSSCGKTQMRKWWQPWGFKWEHGADSYEAFECHTTLCRIDEKCIVAMVNSGDYILSEAIVVMASACERCGNVLIHKYLNGEDGYEEYSDEWKRCHTVCDFCRDEEDPKPVEEKPMTVERAKKISDTIADIKRLENFVNMLAGRSEFITCSIMQHTGGAKLNECFLEDDEKQMIYNAFSEKLSHLREQIKNL